MKLFFTLVFFSLNVGLFAQNSGRGFNYQAVARDANGAIRANEAIELRFSLLPDSSSATPDYIETHNFNTDAYGTFSVIIGHGTPDANASIDSFEDVSFSAHQYWLKTELRDSGSWVLLSNQKLLSVPYAENTTPVGTMVMWAGDRSTVPEGWLVCDGSMVDRTQYQHLFNAIGTGWGQGNGTTTFNIPDMRGLFPRGVSEGSNSDPNKSSRTAMYSGGNSGNNVGSYQADENKEHHHAVMNAGGTATHIGHSNSKGLNGGNTSFSDGSHGSYDVTAGSRGNYISNSGGNESRPKNVYVYFIIKAI
ncbi:MAG: tail fiber protein [Bacteroidetes bacterium]|nr:tail fiber protein [Bacteroidota bacterium]